MTRIGRRIDESTPLVDARLEDGSRVNIIVPPLAIDGPSISIRKFAKKKITLETMVESQNLSNALATVLKIASHTPLAEAMSDNTDFNAGVIAEGTASLEETAAQLWNLVLAVANGRQTRAEALGHREFGIRRIAPTL